MINYLARFFTKVTGGARQGKPTIRRHDRDHLRRTGGLCLSLCFLVGFLFPVNVLPAITRDGNTLLILDASGSMWGRVDGRSKIETARDVIVDLLADDLPRQKLGLMSYGHRRKGDCNDIELLVPPAMNTTPLIKGAVMSIKPLGKTPLSASVIAAARALRYTREKATVVLVSDGRETCDYDPCQVARELEASGVDFTAHVIGFNVTDPVDLSQLRCMAENTGGQFVAAGDSEELSAALQSVSPVLFAAAESGTTARGAADHNADPSPDNATNEGANSIIAGQIDIEIPFDQSAGGHSNTAAAESRRRAAAANKKRGGNADDRSGPAAAGHLTRDDFRRKGSGGTGSKGTGSKGTGSRRQGSANMDSYARGLANGRRQYDSSNGVTMELPASSIAPVDLVATVTAPSVLYTLQTFTARWTGPGLAEDLVTISVPGSSANSWVQAVAPGSSKNLKLIAPELPGEYEVRYLSANKKVLATTTISVRKAEAKLFAPKQARSGRLVRIRWKGGTRDPKDSIVIARKGAPLSSAINRRFIRSQTTVMLLMPSRSGDYELRYIQAGGNLIGSQSIVIK